MSQPKRTLLLLGGSSDIGLAIARHYAAKGCNIQLAGRNMDQLARSAADIRLRFETSVQVHEFDALDIAAHAAFVGNLDPLPDTAVCVVGFLGNQTEDQQSAISSERVISTNYLGPAIILGELANQFEKRGSGTLIGVSSVAGDRGRATNYIYGSAKAGLTAFLSGLRNRLSSSGVHVVTVKPGYVGTRMTAHMDLPPLLTATPEQVAEATYQADVRHRDLIYVKPVWRLVIGIIQAIPERIFKRMRI